MRTVRRWLTRDRFAWTDVAGIGTAVVAVANASLPWIAGIAICIGAGVLTGVVTVLLKPGDDA